VPVDQASQRRLPVTRFGETVMRLAIAVNGRITMKSTVTPLIIIAAIAACSALLADHSVGDNATWPESWPKELEPLRQQSRTFIGGLLNLTYYEIDFTKRATRMETQRAPAAALEGSWHPESIDGQPVSKPATVTFSDGKVAELFRLVAPVAPDGSTQGARQIAKSFDSRVFRHGEFNAIDVDVGGKATNGCKGIYRIEGDVLVIAFQPKLDARADSPWVDKDGRPITFEPDRVVLRVFRRTASAAK
jgi:hypothetical protein